jgi:hypothetical protein
VTFRALLPIANPPFPPSKVMPKHFVPGISVRALCKTVFGDKVAKNVHGDHWRTAEVQGVILPQPLGGKKVLVEWSDAPNNLQKVSEHGQQAFITTAAPAPPTSKTANVSESGVAVPAPSVLPQNRAFFSHPGARPRFQLPLRREQPPVATTTSSSSSASLPQQHVHDATGSSERATSSQSLSSASSLLPVAPELSEVQPAAGPPSVAQPAQCVDVGASESESEDAFSDKADEDPELCAGEPARQAAPLEPNNPLLCHGLQWRPVGSVSHDWGHRPGAWSTRLEWPADLDVPPLHKRQPLHYWLLMQPACMREVLLNTNELFIANDMKPVTPHELITFFGCIFAIALYGGRVGKRRDHWTEPSPSTQFPGLNLGRWMGVRRFEDLLCNMVWGYATNHPSFDAEDLWWPVRQFLDSFNERRKMVVKPGVLLCADESGTKWKGREYQGRENQVDGAPKISVQLRKPEPVHIEVKNICDASTRIMLCMELQEGKEEMAHLTPRGRNVSTACTLRLVHNWRGRGHILLADSWFASVETAVALKSIGVDFIGPVKTATRKFPKRYLQDKEGLPLTVRGEWRAFTADVSEEHTGGHQLWAVVWNEPGPAKPSKPRKVLIATCGTTTIGAPAVRRRRQLQRQPDGSLSVRMYNKLVPRPDVAQTYFQNANAIDKSNRDAQDGIRTERVIKTGYWATRFNVSTLQKVAVDAWRAQNLEQGGKTLHQFMAALIDQMLRNRFCGSNRKRTGRHAKQGFSMPGTEAALWEVADASSDDEGLEEAGVNLRRKRVSADVDTDSSDAEDVQECVHAIQANVKIGIGALTCSFCGAHSSARYHCVQCSQDDNGDIGGARQLRAFCGVGNDRDCHGMELHIQTNGRSDIEAQERRKVASAEGRARKRAKKARRTGGATAR